MEEFFGGGEMIICGEEVWLLLSLVLVNGSVELEGIIEI